MNFFSVCIHQNVLFALHAQMVSSIQKPVHACTFKYKIEIIMTKFTFEIAFAFHELKQWDHFRYRTRAIIGRSRFEAALVYRPRILGLKSEEFPFLIHKLSVI